MAPSLVAVSIRAHSLEQPSRTPQGKLAYLPSPLIAPWSGPPCLKTSLTDCLSLEAWCFMNTLFPHETGKIFWKQGLCILLLNSQSITPTMWLVEKNFLGCLFSLMVTEWTSFQNRTSMLYTFLKPNSSPCFSKAFLYHVTPSLLLQSPYQTLTPTYMFTLCLLYLWVWFCLLCSQLDSKVQNGFHPVVGADSQMGEWMSE